MDALVNDGVVHRADITHEEHIRINQNGSFLNVGRHNVSVPVVNIDSRIVEIGPSKNAVRKRSIMYGKAHRFQYFLDRQWHWRF